MNRIKLFFPAFLGFLLVAISYYLRTLVVANIEADKYLASKIALFADRQNLESRAIELLNGSVNTLLENNHALLNQTIDLMWVFGLIIMLLLFPYRILTGSVK
jgi:hypothetical protein